MENEQEGDAPNHSDHQEPPTWISRRIGQIKSKLQERRAQKQKENPQDRAARRTATATVWIAMFTCVTIAVGLSQFFVFKWQLDEMRSTGAQTDKLIRANEALAAAASTQAAATKIAAEAAQISNRAWLAPLFFSVVGPVTEGQKIQIRILFENEGRTPATDVEFRAIGRHIDGDNGGQIPSSLYRNIKLGENRACEAELTTLSGTLFPASNRAGHVTHFFFDDLTFPARMKSRTTILAMQGCFRYKTLGGWHFSRFCAYLDPSSDRPIEQWSFAECGDGNEAD